MLNILTIDVEDWCHPEYVRHKAAPNTRNCASQNLQAILKLLEEHDSFATFFIVGEIIKRQPELIKQIEENRHEVAFHTFTHEPLSSKTAETLQQEISQFETLTGKSCAGFRAPSFSLNNNTKWALDVLEKNHFKYDSSIFPVSTPLYGVRNAPLAPYKPSHNDVGVEDNNAQLWEFPLHVSAHGFFRIPMAGGFYLRLFPLNLIIRSIKKANKKGRPAVMFVHTWEINPDTPKLKLGHYGSFVTYHNLNKTATKFTRLLSKTKFTSIQNYISETGLS